MSQTKTKHSVSAVYRNSKKTGKKILVGYLSKRDEERGVDIRMDLAGYTIVAL